MGLPARAFGVPETCPGSKSNHHTHQQKKKHTQGSKDTISTWEFRQSQITASQESIFIFHCHMFALLQNPQQTVGHYWKQEAEPNSSFLPCTWWLGFIVLYNIASNFKIAMPPSTFKSNQCQKHPCGYFVFFLHKIKLPLINKTAMIYIHIYYFF